MCDTAVQLVKDRSLKKLTLHLQIQKVRRTLFSEGPCSIEQKNDQNSLTFFIVNGWNRYKSRTQRTESNRTGMKRLEGERTIELSER